MVDVRDSINKEKTLLLFAGCTGMVDVRDSINKEKTLLLLFTTFL